MRAIQRDLRDGRLPSISSRINYSHPLARRLRYLWLLNERGGQSVFSIGPLPGHGTVTGALWSRGLLFDGSDSDFVQIDADARQNVRLPQTVACWVTPDALPGSNNWAFAQDDEVSSSRGWSLGANGTQAYFEVGGGGFGTPTGGVLAVGKKSFLCGVMGDPAVNRLYVDGVHVNDSGSITGLGGATSPITFGRRAYSGFHQPFTGRLHMAAIWDGALQPSDIAWLFAQPYAMIRATNNRQFSVVTTAPTFQPAWARGSNRLIGVGTHVS